MLRRASLPPLEELAAWTRLFYWILQWEQTGASLLTLARESHLEPATCYRLVRRLMDAPWSRVRGGGIAGAILRFRTIWKDAGMHQLALQPFLQVGARRQANGGVVVPAPSSPPWHAVDAPRRPRGVLAARLELGGYPFDVAVAPDDAAWVTRLHAAALERIQLQPFASTGSIHVGVAPTRVALSPGGGRAWVNNQFTRDVAVVDLVLGQRIGSIAMEGNPLGAAVSPDGRTLYVTTNLDRVCACALSDSGGRIVRSTALPLVATGILVHPNGNRVYVPTWKDGALLELDARTLAITHRYDVGGQTLGVAASGDGLRLYCGNEAGWIDLVHLPTGRQVRRQLGSPVGELALTPDQSTLYAGLMREGKVAILDAHSMACTGMLETGGIPRHIAFDRLGAVALIANERGWVDLVR